ncbi:MAG: K+/H+ antiporter subunit F [Porticoccaceae bacterium]|nr:K+/H+ antiporter subunit F [Porticoccaceae bacterium]
MTTLLTFSMGFAFACVILAMVFCFIRLLMGPASQDRILALDTLWMCSMMLAVVFGLYFGDQVYFELALLVALLGFVSTVALTKFLIRGEIIE